jgi:hypothetical protein
MTSETNEPKTVSDYKLRFRPALLKHRYGMLIRHFEQEEETLKLHYGISVKGTGNNTGEQGEIEVDREQVFINNHAPELIAEQFANDIGKCIFPVRLGLNANGSMDNITNEVEIRNRWNKAKTALEEYYKGAVADAVLDQMDRQLSSAKYIAGSLKKDVFFALYFQALYHNYSNGQVHTADFYFPFTAYGTPVLFSVTCKADIAESGDKIVLKIKGISKDERSYRDIVNRKILPSDPNGNKVKGTLDFTCKLYPDSHAIYAITGMVQLADKTDSKAIAVELFHQPDGNNGVQKERKEQQNIIEEQATVSKKPFWAFFKK